VTVAKDNKLKHLQAKFDEQHDDLVEARQSINEVQAELDECIGMNDRLNATLRKERTKIKTLKGVCRFYRAQRDRVDAYLSGTLDGVDREKDARYPKEAYPQGLGSVVDIPPGPQDRRPRVQEPSAMSGDNGRSYESYRDHEPSPEWENL